jgi:hypothetical protein
MGKNKFTNQGFNDFNEVHYTNFPVHERFLSQTMYFKRWKINLLLFILI